MVDVQQGSLRSLEQQSPAALHRLVEQIRNVGHHRPDPGAKFQRRIDDPFRVDRLGVQIARQDEVVVLERLADPVGEPLFVEQVLGAHGAPPHLVLVGGADSAPRGSNRVVAAPYFARAIQRNMVVQDQRTVAADRQPPAHIHAGLLQLIDLS